LITIRLPAVVVQPARKTALSFASFIRISEHAYQIKQFDCHSSRS